MKQRFSRQGFLGDKGQEAIERARIGICGLGGGGSHIVQQCAHIGFLDILTFDGDWADESNLNRTVTLRESDIEAKTLKVEAGRRRALEICSDVRVDPQSCRWQDKPELLRTCDIVFGSVDGFGERRELETCCRRFMIPLIDIGMDVHAVDGGSYVMTGQVILSMPGHPCMFCMNFLNEQALAKEARRYGDAGPRPQVVWPNGVLASTAVGIAVDLLTDWSKTQRGPVFLSYRGDVGTLQVDNRLKYVPKVCSHYPPEEVGAPILRRV
jgi:molybdopterin/thiamine biosynthesis adenylyltransferase